MNEACRSNGGVQLIVSFPGRRARASSPAAGPRRIRVRRTPVWPRCTIWSWAGPARAGWTRCRSRTNQRHHRPPRRLRHRSRRHPPFPGQPRDPPLRPLERRPPSPRRRRQPGSQPGRLRRRRPPESPPHGNPPAKRPGRARRRPGESPPGKPRARPRGDRPGKRPSAGGAERQIAARSGGCRLPLLAFPPRAYRTFDTPTVETTCSLVGFGPGG